MSEYYYREIDGGSHRPMGPYDTADEARKAARYKGLRNIQVVRKSGSSYELVDGVGGAQKPAPASGSGGRTA